MSTFTQYADAVREVPSDLGPRRDALTTSAKQSLAQVQETVAAAAKAEPFAHVLNYLTRTVESQGDVSKKFAAISAELSAQVLTQGDAMAAATRDYFGTAQEVLRDQAGKHYDDFTHARQRIEKAFRNVTGATAA